MFVGEAAALVQSRSAITSRSPIFTSQPGRQSGAGRPTRHRANRNTALAIQHHHPSRRPLCGSVRTESKPPASNHLPPPPHNATPTTTNDPSQRAHHCWPRPCCRSPPAAACVSGQQQQQQRHQSVSRLLISSERRRKFAWPLVGAAAARHTLDPRDVVGQAQVVRRVACQNQSAHLTGFAVGRKYNHLPA